MRHVVGTLQVEPLDATFGAVVRDVDLKRVSDETIAELTELWLEYALLVFPDQQLTPNEQDELARCFGDSSSPRPSHEHPTGWEPPCD